MQKQVLKGEADYDDKYDILLLKVSNRSYRRSIELDDFVIDFDNKNRLMGVQIFDASEYLHVSNETLSKISRWELKITVSGGKIGVQLAFQVKVKDKIVERIPTITNSLSQFLPDSELVCEVG